MSMQVGGPSAGSGGGSPTGNEPSNPKGQEALENVLKLSSGASKQNYTSGTGVGMDSMA